LKNVSDYAQEQTVSVAEADRAMEEAFGLVEKNLHMKTGARVARKSVS
jgi:hypothetical protein